jgi:hypothetical protein
MIFWKKIEVFCSLRTRKGPLMRYQKINFIFLFIFLFSLKSFSFFEDSTIVVFDIQKTLPLSRDEKSVKNYFLSGGIENGLKKNMLISVYRRQLIQNEFHQKSEKNVLIPVGTLKIIYVIEGLSIARLHQLDSNSLLEYDTIMKGDILKKHQNIQQNVIMPSSQVTIDSTSLGRSVFMPTDNQ